ncbi:AraC family transcriptional regulator [Acinetobacter defluvii]|uniref:AraC family transcriptional regulator n=1 Tax=Acinetobacter defluvii TaxID=1871111 RepID=A0A2S2F9W3_9GAMM|nr:AraC family transcriptional regulator [Acinetobacter defluvii]AWL27700.1 AraC family transcriptional regulator [Acinetobacter defluvii]
MQQLKDYTGTVYGGLGQLLYVYAQAKNLEISDKLQRVQNLERFEFQVWRELLDEINAQVHSSALGLEIAEYIQPKHLGVIAYITQSCDTLGEAITRYYDFHRLIYDGGPLKVEAQGDLLSIRWEVLPVDLTTQITDEIALAILVQFLRLYIQREYIQIEGVNFIQPAPKNIRIYQDFFNAPIKFSQAKVELLFSLNFFSAPCKNPDSTLQQIMQQQAQELLAKLPNSTQIDERLQHSILKGLQKNNYQIETIATQLQMSVRQLQRHLQQQETTYQERVQEIRQLLAKQYLQDPHLSLHEIAILLSYSEQSAFQRAFKLWSGLTPRQWRNSQLKNAKKPILITKL